MGASELVNPRVPELYMRKESALKVPFSGLVLPIGAAYVYGQHVRGKAMRGERVGHISAMMAEHPFVTGLVGSAAISAMRVGRLKKSLVRSQSKMKGAASPAANKLVKGAGERLLRPHELGKLAGMVGDTVAEYLAFRSLPGAILDTLLFKAIDKGSKAKKAGTAVQ
jgi:hypothetical protein